MTDAGLTDEDIRILGEIAERLKGSAERINVLESLQVFLQRLEAELLESD